MLSEKQIYGANNAFWLADLGACSSDRLERTPDKREVDGSIPSRPTTTTALSGGVAQLGERLPCTQEVIGSNPFTSTSRLNPLSYLQRAECWLPWAH
jgi:hypothetical protein